MKKANLACLMISLAFVSGASIGFVSSTNSVPANAVAVDEGSNENETIDVYFEDLPGWGANTSVYYWGGDPEVTWPGDKMTFAYQKANSVTYIYKAAVPVGSSIIFNNRNGAQTVNINNTDVSNNKCWYTGSTEETGAYNVSSYDMEFFSISFDANGGTGEMASQESCYYYANKVKLNANTFVAPSGKRFVSWNTEADGSGKSYSNEGDVLNADFPESAGGELTLYAQYGDEFDENTYYLVGSEIGWESATAPFTKIEDNKYSLEKVSFVQDEEFRVRKGTSNWIDNNLFQNEYVFNTNIDKTGQNLKVTEAGAQWEYSFYITTDADGAVTEVWTAFYLNVDHFCDVIAEKTDDICAVNQGHNKEALKTPWSELATEFATYPDCEKDKFRAIVASEDPEATKNQKMAYRYDYIVNLYQLDNFASRTTTTIPNYNVISSSDNTALIAVTTIIAVVAATSVAVVVVMKKHKEN